MKTLVLTFVAIFCTATIFSQTARVQLIHNSADFNVEVVDVYVESILAVDNFTFRNATAFVDLPAGIEIDIAIALGNSTGAGSAFYVLPVTLVNGGTYVGVLSGIESPAGYNPSPPFELNIQSMARETATNPANVDILLYHGSTDAPTIDVVETQVGLGTIVDNISYTQFEGYIELPTEDYIVEIRTADGNTGLAAYQAPLQTLGFNGAALTVLASGFFDPSQNLDGPSLGLYAATPVGGPLLELPAADLGVSDFQKNGFAIYPNPTKNTVTIDLATADLALYKIVISDLSGRTISSEMYTVSKNTINIGNLASGLYSISILEGNKLISATKLVKE